LEQEPRLRCYDCIHLAPLDVFKGVCHISKNTVLADDDACVEFEPVPKCRFCSEYRPISGESFLGTCGSRVPTYPDLVAKTCDSFRWREGLPLALKPGGSRRHH